MQKGTSFKHLTLTQRFSIERLLLKNYNYSNIADMVGCSIQTIYNEVKRARYIHLNSDYTEEDRYAPETAHSRYRANMKRKGSKPKLLQYKELKEYIEALIKYFNYSPEACVFIMQQENLNFGTTVCVNTIYNGIAKGYFDGISLADLPRKGKQKRKKRRITQEKSLPGGTSIEKRNEKLPDIEERSEFGHWEMDCVIGKATNRKTLLVLTERKTRYEIIEPLKSKTTKEVVKALNRLEKRFKSAFYSIFKSITVDNGSEFKDFKGMEKALYRKGKRTQLYYCHPRRPEERGSNENCNILVRRKFPKGTDFDKTVTRTKVKDAEFWINTYPRRLFNGECAADLFKRELRILHCRFDL